MSREIKFQAFDATVGLGQMIDVTELKYDVHGDLDTVIGYAKDDKEPVIIRVTSHTHIRQFTGLKDCNDKDIYVGDIVRETYPAGYSFHEVCWGKYDNDKIYEDADIGLGVYTKERLHWSEHPLEIEIEIGSYQDIQGIVIGNIYENPTLISESS